MLATIDIRTTMHFRFCFVVRVECLPLTQTQCSISREKLMKFYQILSLFYSTVFFWRIFAPSGKVQQHSANKITSGHGRESSNTSHINSNLSLSNSNKLCLEQHQSQKWLKPNSCWFKCTVKEIIETLKIVTLSQTSWV